MRLRTLFLFACLHLAMSILCQDKAKKLAAIMKAYHQYNMFDGVVLVAENGKIIYKDAFGMANREWNIPNQADTKFMIGSLSKPLTAVLTLIQVQKGLIALDKPIADYLPVFKNKPAANVTIRQLLSHTSGMPNYDIIRDFFPRISRQYFSREDYLKIFIDSALAFPPGTQYAYSSWGYFTLGFILETVTHKTYAELMKQDIFNQIGMKNSGSYYHTQIIQNRATGYDYSFGGYSSSDFRDQSNTMGTGDVYSTVEDLFKFHMALSGNSLLNKELRDLMFTPGMPPANYGFGWFNKPFRISATDTVNTNFHLGMTEGFISFFRRVPATGTMVVILCNSSPTDFFGITNNLMKVVYDQPVHIKEPAHKKMEMLIQKDGVEEAISAFKKMKLDTGHYYVDWISLDFLARQLYDLKRYAEAEKIAVNNAEEFPEKDLVQVTLANIYLVQGRNEKAKEYYKKALQINPQYEEARNRLKELGLK